MFNVKASQFLMQSFVRVVVQSEVNECMVLCMDTLGGQDTNTGTNTAHVCLSVSRYSLCPVAYLSSSMFARSTCCCITAWILTLLRQLSDGLSNQILPEIPGTLLAWPSSPVN